MDILRDCFSKYWECEKLMEVESKNDPETEPYRSKYKAKTLLLEMKDFITKHLENLSTNDFEFPHFRTVLTAVLGRIGLVYFETDELPAAEQYFRDCLESIVDHLDPLFIVLSIWVRNQLGIFHLNKSQVLEAKKCLEDAERLYNDFRIDKTKVAKHFYDFFEIDENKEGEKELEMAHTLTKFYLAQVYGALKDVLKSAIYCHETLKRELIYQEYDPIDWALNSATISQVFLERTLFKQARHHLAAASHILDSYEETLRNERGTEEEMDAKREEFRHRSSDVSRCWAKYGIFLLEHSKNLMGDEVEEKNENLENVFFDSLDLSLYESQITASNVVTFEDAREVFLITQKHLNIAKDYYKLEDRASDHAQIVQDHSNLFRHLTAFEPNQERQFKMMKKRVDMLEALLKELNPRYYLDLCRKLWFELGNIYHDMMQIKFEKMKESNENHTLQSLMKINALTELSVNNFNYFLNSVKDKISKEFPDSVPEEFIEPVVVAHFYLGRLYFNYVTQDKRKKIENMTKAYECFKYIVDTCEKNESAKNVIGEELNISKDMMTLLQMKILQLQMKFCWNSEFNSLNLNEG